MKEDLTKYPRTKHLEGSRFQVGDEEDYVPFSSLKDCYIVIEEKIDGANSGISFNDEGEILVQSRGHFIAGGHRERHFLLLKSWAETNINMLFEILTNRFILYGEYLLAYHTIFYDNLPHYFLEFDIWDKQENKFLSTAARRKLIGDAPIKSVPVLYEGIAPAKLEDITSLLGKSLYRTDNWRDNFKEAIKRSGMSEHYQKEVFEKSDTSDLAEGLYIKIENEDETIGRLKWVRSSFIQSIIENGTHWLDRPIVKNMLAPEVDIYSM